MANISYGEIKNKFNDYLLNILKIKKDKDLSTKDLIQKYNAEFKAFLVSYEEANIDTFSKNAENIDKQPDTVLDEMFKEYMQDVGSLNEAYKLADLDNNGQISDDERNNFFLSINSIDDNTKTVSLDDLTIAIRGIENKDSSILNLFNKNTASGQGAQATSQSQGSQGFQVNSPEVSGETKKASTQVAKKDSSTGKSNENDPKIKFKLKASEKEVSSYKNRLEQIKEEVQKQKKEVDGKETELEKAKKRIEEYRKLVTSKHKKLQSKTNSNASEEEIEAAQKEYSNAQNVYRTCMTEYNQVKSRYNSAVSELKTSEQQRDVAQAAFEGAQEMQKVLEQDATQAKAKLDEYKAKKESAQTKLENSNKNIQTLETKKSTLSKFFGVNACNMLLENAKKNQTECKQECEKTTAKYDAAYQTKNAYENAKTESQSTESDTSKTKISTSIVSAVLPLITNIAGKVLGSLLGKK